MIKVFTPPNSVPPTPKTKTKNVPTRLKLKNNPDTREANLMGSFRLKSTNLVYNLNYPIPEVHKVLLAIIAQSSGRRREIVEQDPEIAARFGLIRDD